MSDRLMIKLDTHVISDYPHSAQCGPAHRRTIFSNFTAPRTIKQMSDRLMIKLDTHVIIIFEFGSSSTSTLPALHCGLIYSENYFEFLFPLPAYWDINLDRSYTICTSLSRV